MKTATFAAVTIVLLLVGAFSAGSLTSCAGSGTREERVADVAFELSSAATTLRELAPLYQDAHPERAEKLLLWASRADVAAGALQGVADGTSTAESAVAAIEAAALAIVDDPEDEADVRAAAVLARAALRSATRLLSR